MRTCCDISTESSRDARYDGVLFCIEGKISNFNAFSDFAFFDDFFSSKVCILSFRGRLVV